MNTERSLWLLGFVRMAAKLFLVAFLAMSVIYSKIAVGGWLQLAFISLLIAYRLVFRRVIFFVSDQMLYCLPYFWAAANLGSIEAWPEGWFVAAGMLSLICLVVTGASLLEVQKNRKLVWAVLLSFSFLAGFSFMLYEGYAAVDGQLFYANLLNMSAFAAGIPLSLTAFPMSAEAAD